MGNSIGYREAPISSMKFLGSSSEDDLESSEYEKFSFFIFPIKSGNFHSAGTRLSFVRLFIRLIVPWTLAKLFFLSSQKSALLFFLEPGFDFFTIHGLFSAFLTFFITLTWNHVQTKNASEGHVISAPGWGCFAGKVRQGANAQRGLLTFIKKPIMQNISHEFQDFAFSFGDF